MTRYHDSGDEHVTTLEQAEKLAELASIRDRAVGAVKAIERLEELLTDESSEVRAEAAGAVVGYPGESSLVGTVLELAESDADAAVRVQALEALGAVIAEGDLAGATQDGYSPLSDLGEPSREQFERTRDLLLKTVASPKTPEEGVAASLSLAFLSAQAEAVKAIERLQAAGDVKSRVSAFRCMGRSGDPRWADAIRAGLEEDEEKLVAAAIEAAGRVEIVDAAPLLSRILRSTRQSQTLRVCAATALGRLGGKSTGSVLLEVADDDPDEVVREAAGEALAGLTLLGSNLTSEEE